MDLNARMKGIDFGTVYVGGNPTVDYGIVAPQPSQEDGERPPTWWDKHGGEVIEAVPEVLCALFPEQCRKSRPAEPRPVIIQQQKTDWVLIAAIIIAALLLVLILKK